MRLGPVLFLAFVFGIGCFFFAAIFGLLPDSVQLQLAQYSSMFLPHSAAAPYLEKYEGAWKLTLASTNGNAGVDCPAVAGTIEVHNGAFASVLADTVAQRTVSGTIAPDGSLEGTLSAGPQRGGTLSGSISGASGEGSWRDDFDCTGALTLTKLGSVMDPYLGRIANYTGTLGLERGGQQQRVYPGEVLYAGDVITVVDGSATLSLGLYPPKVINLSAGDSYTVPQSIQ